MAQKSSVQICEIPKILEFQFHNQQQLNSIITINNTQDFVVNYKIKSNRPELYLVKPMEGSIFRQDHVKITFKRKQLLKTDFEAYLRNPNTLPAQKFLIQISYNKKDAVGRQKKITQQSYLTVRFRGGNPNSSNKQKKQKSQILGNNIKQKNRLQQLNNLKQNLQNKEQQLIQIQSTLKEIHNQFSPSKQPIVLKDIIILVIIAFMMGLAL